MIAPRDAPQNRPPARSGSGVRSRPRARTGDALAITGESPRIEFRVPQEVWAHLRTLGEGKSPHEWARKLLLECLAQDSTEDALLELNARLDAMQHEHALQRTALEALLLNVVAIQASLAGLDAVATEARVSEARTWLSEQFGEAV